MTALIKDPNHIPDLSRPVTIRRLHAVLRAGGIHNYNNDFSQDGYEVTEVDGVFYIAPRLASLAVLPTTERKERREVLRRRIEAALKIKQIAFKKDGESISVEKT